MFSFEYSEVFKNTYFEVETLVNEIYSCFLMSENKAGILKLFTVKGDGTL